MPRDVSVSDPVTTARSGGVGTLVLAAVVVLALVACLPAFHAWAGFDIPDAFDHGVIARSSTAQVDALARTMLAQALLAAVIVAAFAVGMRPAETGRPVTVPLASRIRVRRSSGRLARGSRERDGVALTRLQQ